MKKLLRLTIRILILIVVIITIVAIAKPELIPHPGLRSQAERVEFGPLLSKSAEKTKSLVEEGKHVKIPSGLSGLPEEVVVEDVVANFSQQLKTMPEQKANEIKAHICTEYLNQQIATPSADATKTN